MKKKLSVTLAICAIAPLGLAACGGEEESASSSSGSSSSESASGSGSTIEITAVEDGSFAYEEASVEAEAGPVTIEFENPAALGHDVRVEGSDGDIGGTEVISEDTTSATVELEPGDYTFYCSVAGHREGGMEGDLTVE